MIISVLDAECGLRDDPTPLGGVSLNKESVLFVVESLLFEERKTVEVDLTEETVWSLAMFKRSVVRKPIVIRLSVETLEEKTEIPVGSHIVVWLFDVVVNGRVAED